MTQLPGCKLHDVRYGPNRISFSKWYIWMDPTCVYQFQLKHLLAQQTPQSSWPLHHIIYKLLLKQKEPWNTLLLGPKQVVPLHSNTMPRNPCCWPLPESARTSSLWVHAAEGTDGSERYATGCGMVMVCGPPNEVVTWVRRLLKIWSTQKKTNYIKSIQVI